MASRRQRTCQSYSYIFYHLIYIHVNIYVNNINKSNFCCTSKTLLLSKLSTKFTLVWILMWAVWPSPLYQALSLGQWCVEVFSDEVQGRARHQCCAHRSSPEHCPSAQNGTAAKFFHRWVLPPTDGWPLSTDMSSGLVLQQKKYTIIIITSQIYPQSTKVGSMLLIGCWHYTDLTILLIHQVLDVIM